MQGTCCCMCSQLVSPKENIELKCKCRGRENVFVEEVVCMCIHVCLRFCLENFANNQQNHTRILCVCVVRWELYEFAESSFKLPFWETAFPALLKRAVRDWRALGMKRHGLVSVCPRFVYCTQRMVTMGGLSIWYTHRTLGLSCK